MYRKPADRQPASDVSPWLASILMRQDGRALQRFAVYYRQLSAMPRRWRRLLRRRVAVGLSSAALALALVGPMAAAPAQPAAPDATIFVVNGEVADVQNNKCSLIEAIINARTVKPAQMRADCATGNVNGPDTVSLPTGGEFVLTEPHNQQFGYTGLPVITSAVTIDGHGSTIVAEEYAYPSFRIMAVDTDGHLTLKGTTISGGRAMSGGAIAYVGGGILSMGALTLIDAEISGNYAGVDFAYGGGLWVEGPTTITNSVITDNYVWGSSYAMGGGLGIGRAADVTIINSHITNNKIKSHYGSYGAGIYVNGQAQIIDSVISGNLNRGDEDHGEGGGIAVTNYGILDITGSAITGNAIRAFLDEYWYSWNPGVGGGLSNRGVTTISNTTISGNQASWGGGLANLYFGDLTVVNSTISGNRAVEEATYYDPDNVVGGMAGGFFAGTTESWQHCSTTTLRGVILSGNTADVSDPEALARPASPNCSTALNVAAHNVFGHSGSSGLTGFAPGATDGVPIGGLATVLSPLADNGGPTLTHALPADSPALDLAPNASCTAAPVNGVDQRGEPRNQNGAGGVTGNECDAGAFELGQPVAEMGFYLSAADNGNAGGVAFAPGDIVRFTPGGGWSMFFDASDVGLTKNVTAFEIEDNGDVLLALAAKQNVAGAGLVQPQDVLRFVPTSTGNTTAGSFTLEVDGSANLLTTAGEKIDALGRTNGRLAISTIDVAVVKRPDMTTLKAQDEDALGFNPVNGQWSEFFNGTPIPGLKVEDVNGLWIDTATGDLYLSIAGAFNVGGVAGNGRDIVKLTPDAGAPGGYTAALFWDGSDAGFPVNIDGLEMVP